MRVLLATRNAGKIEELQRILAPYGVELVGLDPDFEPGPETAPDFRGNALAKAREAAAHSGLPSVADDSGLAVDALNGMPGVLSARWAGRHGDDVGNLELLLGQIADVSEDRRTARFVCAAAAVLPDGRELVVEESVEGHIIASPRGTNGFGYDPIFVPEGYEITSAEMTAEEKDAESHRGRALKLLVPYLRKLA